MPLEPAFLWEKGDRFLTGRPGRGFASSDLAMSPMELIAPVLSKVGICRHGIPSEDLFLERNFEPSLEGVLSSLSSDARGLLSQGCRELRRALESGLGLGLCAGLARGPTPFDASALFSDFQGSLVKVFGDGDGDGDGDGRGEALGEAFGEALGEVLGNTKGDGRVVGLSPKPCSQVKSPLDLGLTEPDGTFGEMLPSNLVVRKSDLGEPLGEGRILTLWFNASFMLLLLAFFSENCVDLTKNPPTID